MTALACQRNPIAKTPSKSGAPSRGPDCDLTFPQGFFTTAHPLSCGRRTNREARALALAIHRGVNHHLAPVEPRQVKTAAEARQLVEARGATHVKVAVTDIDGLLRGKYLHKDKFFSALEHGFGFCDVVLGWDMSDQLYDNVAYTGWHTAYPDAPLRIVPESCRSVPFEDTLFFLAEFAQPAEALCPRSLLRRMVEKAQALGFEPYAALEYEFFVFDETPQSVRAKHYRDPDAHLAGPLRVLDPAQLG